MRVDNFYRDILYFFFFKQKKAYEMRISDWSSDVCSSDLGGAQPPRRRAIGEPAERDHVGDAHVPGEFMALRQIGDTAPALGRPQRAQVDIAEADAALRGHHPGLPAQQR